MHCQKGFDFLGKIFAALGLSVFAAASIDCFHKSHMLFNAHGLLDCPHHNCYHIHICINIQAPGMWVVASKAVEFGVMEVLSDAVAAA